jgi:Rab family protein
LIFTLILFLAGSEKYRSITTGHYRFALGAILVYDIMSSDSFKSCSYWVESIRNYADENCVIALVGNKTDTVNMAPHRRQVYIEEA